jgi:hypothetical protein
VQNACRVEDGLKKLVEEKCIQPGTVPNGECTPSSVFLDNECLAEVLPRLSPKPLSNLTATEAASVVTAFAALQEKCAAFTDQVSSLC